MSGHFPEPGDPRTPAPSEHGVGEHHHKTFPYYHGLTYLDLGFSASYLRRFHMCRVKREQSLTDHSIRVGYLWRVLFEKWKLSIDTTGVEFDFTQCELLGLKLAMDHDLAETLTGDVPSHSKSAAAKKELDRIEHEVLLMVTDGVTHLSHLTDPQIMASSEWQVAKALLKLADIGEGLIFSYYNQGLGADYPDHKSRWVNNNWNKIATEYTDRMDPMWFSPDFKAEQLSWIVNAKCGICPQHA